MTTIRTRAAKGSALSATEYDDAVKRTPVAKSSNYTLDASHNREVHELANGITVTLPTLPLSTETGDWRVTLKAMGSSGATIATGGQSVDGSTSNITLVQYESVTIAMNATGTGFLKTASVLEIQTLIDAAKRVTFAGIISSSGPSEATKYYHPNGNVSDVYTSPNVVAAPSPTDFTLTSFRTRLATNTFNGVLTLTVMVNGFATAATVTYAAGETGAKSWSGSVAISAGDAIEVRFAESATTGNISQLAWAMS